MSQLRVCYFDFTAQARTMAPYGNKAPGRDHLWRALDGA